MTKILSIVILLFSFVSCNKKKEKVNFTSTIEKTDDNIILDLPDTIFVNQVIRDTIYYKSPLDTIKLSEKDNRYIFFYATTDSVKYESVEQIKKTKHRSFIEKTKGVIPFSVQFEKIGDNYFTGIVKDQVLLPNYYKDGKARIITHESVVTVRVWVRPILKSRL